MQALTERILVLESCCLANPDFPFANLDVFLTGSNSSLWIDFVPCSFIQHLEVTKLFCKKREKSLCLHCNRFVLLRSHFQSLFIKFETLSLTGGYLLDFGPTWEIYRNNQSSYSCSCHLSIQSARDCCLSSPNPSSSSPLVNYDNFPFKV